MNNHRSWSRGLFLLTICAALGVAANRAAADPSDLEVLEKRSSFRGPNDFSELKATALERSIVIGPVPGFTPWGRYPHRWSPVTATSRGPRGKRQAPYYYVTPSVGFIIRSAR